ncbi:MAG: BrnT family toxin [Verrucomicrobiota bacterium]
MEFEWSLFSSPGGEEGASISHDEISESFEDPFGLRLLPDSPRFAEQSRFFSLGRTLSGKPLFAVYASTGKIIKVVTAREMTREECFLYDRRAKESV